MALAIWLGVAANASAQEADTSIKNSTSTLKSIKTVDELLALDNENALRRAQARRFGESAIPGGLPTPNGSPLPEIAAAAPIQKLETRVAAVAIYGSDSLTADLHAAGQLHEGVRVGSVVAGCTVNKITPQRVKFRQSKCPDAVWTGEIPVQPAFISTGAYLGAPDVNPSSFPVAPIPMLK